MDALLALGALDVYFTAAGMKKSRPGVVLTCLCRPEQRDAMLRCIFRNTTTLGVRERSCARYSLVRCTQTVQTRFGPVCVKTAQGYGVTREKAEYDDLARRARESGQPLDEIRAAVAQALKPNETSCIRAVRIRCGCAFYLSEDFIRVRLSVKVYIFCTSSRNSLVRRSQRAIIDTL